VNAVKDTAKTTSVTELSNLLAKVMNTAAAEPKDVDVLIQSDVSAIRAMKHNVMQLDPEVGEPVTVAGEAIIYLAGTTSSNACLAKLSQAMPAKQLAKLKPMKDADAMEFIRNFNSRPHREFFKDCIHGEGAVDNFQTRLPLVERMVLESFNAWAKTKLEQART
jgi:hypothetical protein